ncbi:MULTISPECIES: site-specific integrase [Pseudomonas syringae group genomosp. 2]|nr:MULTISPECIES: site-specific integrase [Pseudomonas syringae group genomosp. 2]KPW22605.1 hypothetical protein ALO90_200141 [Pseudomonas amygdali pv. aesculi]MCQ3013783.1 site-specific integrase [Pseudomonas savastanoi]
MTVREMLVSPDIGEDVVLGVDRFVTSRLGYELEVFSRSGKLLPMVLLPDDTTRTVYLQLGEINLIRGELGALVKKFITFTLERYHAGTVSARISFLRMFSVDSPDGNSFFDALDQLLCQSKGRDKEVLITSAKALVRFLIVHEYDFDIRLAEDFLSLEGYTEHQNSYSALFMMDEELGPFSREEVAVLLREVDNDTHSCVVRVILDLCLNFGLRPIQISLLKRKDFIYDKMAGLHYLRVPRVKGSSQYRRVNFTTRLVRESTVTLLEGLFKSQTDLPLHVNEDELPIFLRSRPLKLRFRPGYDSPLVPRAGYMSSKSIYQSEHKRSYALHCTPHHIWRVLHQAEKSFPLSPRTGKNFHLNPYRFRYTLGTMAVVSGCAPEEVAELLDHQNILSVKHYFKFSLEMWELLESATSNRVEQQMFTAAWMNEETIPNNMYSRVVHEVRGFNAIGRCASKTACFEEPAVACYSCKRFCPNKSKVVHEDVLNGLEDRRSHLLAFGDSQLVSAIDESIAGCKAAIAYSAGIPVVSIYPASESS